MATKTSAAAKPRGLALNIGLNSVNPKHYGGWTGDLAACEFDAKDMAALAAGRGIKATQLLTKDATRAKLLSALRAAAKTLVKGDIFMLTYSGHGGQVPDVSGDEADKLDETWCLYDAQLIDDELYLELGRFAAGVRILVLSDSCHSGTVVRAAPPGIAAQPPDMRSKMMPPSVAMRTYEAHKDFYDKLQQQVVQAEGEARAEPDEVLAALTVSPRLTKIAGRFKARAILISGCQDNQSSYDGQHNGAFTARLLTVWNRGNFDGNYASFHAHIKAGMPAIQTPNLFTMGPVAGFLKQKPFSV
ncbi:MAG TPA: caspase family protein [Rubrivivax sp.]|nr:caspase family protein [Rubrivivax sp.]